LIDLAKQRGASQAKPWIRDHPSELEEPICFSMKAWYEACTANFIATSDNISKIIGQSSVTEESIALDIGGYVHCKE